MNDMNRNNKVKNNSNKEKENKVRWGRVLASILAFLVMIVIASAVVLVLKNGKASETDVSISEYIALFSILITMISILIPITSHFNNKEDLKKFEKENEELKKNLDNKFSEESAKLEDLSKANEIRSKSFEENYLQLLEGISNKHTLGDNDKNCYYNATIKYIAAKDEYNNGLYAKCEERLKEAIGYIQGTIKDEVTEENKKQLIIYKVFNLYRRLAGRTRNFEGFDNHIGRIRDNLIGTSYYSIVMYIYVKSELDKIEKCFIFDRNSTKADDILEKIKYFEPKTPDSSIYLELQYESLLSRYYYVLSYHKYFSKYNDAYTHANKAKGKLDEIGFEGENKIYYIIEKEIRYLIAYIFEKLSYCLKKDQGEFCLTQADKLLEELIKREKKSKYYLEKSEILSKMGTQKKNDYEYVAQYGCQLYSNDPFLAAQCAQIYIQKYLRHRNQVHYLMTAKEYIIIAYYVYNQEKKEKTAHGAMPLINAKFSFIASLYAYIQTYIVLADGCFDLNDKDEIKSCINHSTEIDVIKAPNYFRGIVCWYELYQYEKNKTDGFPKVISEDEFLINVRELIEKYVNEVAQTFGLGAYFYEISNKISEFYKKHLKEIKNTSDTISELEVLMIDIKKYA